MGTTDRAVRWSTIAVVAAVAGVAGWISYRHALAVVRSSGETGTVAYADPVTVDGLIYAASMGLLNSARRGTRPPAIARPLLGVGIAATLFANIAAGLRYGVLGAAVAGWPALALVGSYELLMTIIRADSRPRAVPAVLATSNGHDQLASVFAEDLAAGRVPSFRKVREALKVGQDRAGEVRGHLAGILDTAARN